MTLRIGRKATAALAASALLWGLAAVPAIAEDAWVSSLTNAGKGFSSRWWTDRHSDSSATRIRLRSCEGGTDSNYLVEKVRFQLWRDNGLFPDHDHGFTTSNCDDQLAYWGQMREPGSYKWTVGNMYVDYLGSSDHAWIPGGRVTVPSLSTGY